MNKCGIACVDVGQRLGWAYLTQDGVRLGTGIGQLVNGVGTDLNGGRRVALGFECPLYVPRHQDGIVRGRAGEGSYSWCSPVGVRVLGVGLVQVNAVLGRLREMSPGVIGTTRWRDFEVGVARLLIWEAFVTARQGPEVALRAEWLSTAGQDEKDALAGAKAFELRFRGGVMSSDLGKERGVSLAAFQLLATGFSTDLTLLNETCLVIKARKPS